MHSSPRPADTRPTPDHPPEPVRSSADALHLLSLAVRHPLQPETLAFLLSADGVGGVILAVDGTHRPDDVLDVVEVMAQAGNRVPHAAALVVASVRPESGTLPGDIDRWLEASDLAELHGTRLLEWYIIGPTGAECPRDLLGEPTRWPRPEV
jgi:sugar/nucleoside kinase (ribokinase family)